MKIHPFKICAVLLGLCLLLAACGKESDPAIRGASDPSENVPATEAASTSEPSLSETYDADPAKQTLEHYRAVYSAEAVFSDLFVPQKYLLIGQDTVAELLLIDGYSQAKELCRKAIERVESKALTDFCSIEIFDKTNEHLSILVNSEAAEEIAALLRPKYPVKEDVSHA